MVNFLRNRGSESRLSILKELKADIGFIQKVYSFVQSVLQCIMYIRPSNDIILEVELLQTIFIFLSFEKVQAAPYRLSICKMMQ